MEEESKRATSAPHTLRMLYECIALTYTTPTAHSSRLCGDTHNAVAEIGSFTDD